MVTSWKKALLYLVGAYWIVTLLVVGLIIALGAIYHLPGAAELGVSVGQSPAYVQSMPWHPLVNLGVWLFFGWLYLKGVAPAERRREAVRLGALWVAVSIVKDYLVWVVIPSPVQMTHREMYVEYAPWLYLIYLAIFLSPVLVARLTEGRKPATEPAVHGEIDKIFPPSP